MLFVVIVLAIMILLIRHLARDGTLGFVGVIVGALFAYAYIGHYVTTLASR